MVIVMIEAVIVMIAMIAMIEVLVVVVVVVVLVVLTVAVVIEVVVVMIELSVWEEEQWCEEVVLLLLEMKFEVLAFLLGQASHLFLCVMGCLVYLKLLIL